MDDERLVVEVEKYVELYDQSSRHYKDNSKKVIAWRAIALEIGSSVGDAADGLIPPDALRQRYGSGTSWPRSPQQIGSTLINETISTGRGCGASQQRPRSGVPRRSAIVP
ncbi:unnamed protein product [Boreogadus saida]